MRANAIEAAEQCGILTLPEIAEPLRARPPDRRRATGRLLVFCDEDAEVKDPVAALAARAPAPGEPAARRADRAGRRLCRGRARRAARDCRTWCGSRSARASCAPTPPRSRRWRWSAPCSATGGEVRSLTRPAKNACPPVKSVPEWRRNRNASVLKPRRANGFYRLMSSAAPCRSNQQPDARAQALVASYERAGYPRVSPAILQPAEPFLDLSGEDIRKRMFLRPIRTAASWPAARPHHPGLARLSRLEPRRQGGRLLLSRPGVPPSRRRPERIPASRHESFGRSDIAAADAEMLALGLEATAHYGVAAPEIRIGDVGLFAALIAALDLAPAWKRRLIKDFNHKTSLAHDLDRLTISASHARPEYQGVLAALAGSNPKGFTDLSSGICGKPGSASPVERSESTSAFSPDEVSAINR